MAGRSYGGVQAAARAAGRILDPALDEALPRRSATLLAFPGPAQYRETLAEIARRIGSSRYRNAEAYQMLFTPLRDRAMTLCEIEETGAPQGLWSGYFPQLRQVAPADLSAGEAPGIVIDAGSLDCAAQQAAFLELFPRLAPGGFYLIENLRAEDPEDGIRSASLFRHFSEKRRFPPGDPRFAPLAPQIAGVLMLQVGFNKNRRDQVAVVQKR